MTLHTIDIIMCALGFYALGFFITAGIWALFRVLAGRPRTENYWRRLFILSCFSWIAVVSFVLVFLELLLIGIGSAIEEKIKGPEKEAEEEEKGPEDVN